MESFVVVSAFTSQCEQFWEEKGANYLSFRPRARHAHPGLTKKLHCVGTQKQVE